MFEIQFIWLELQPAEGWLPRDSQGWPFPFPGLQISSFHRDHPQGKTPHSGAASFRCSCGLCAVIQMWGQMQGQQCWLSPAGDAECLAVSPGKPLGEQGSSLGIIPLLESCQLCPLVTPYENETRLPQGSLRAQDLILLLSLTSLMNSEVSRSKY